MSVPTMKITSREALRSLYTLPKGRAVAKQLDFLDAHCRKFISLAPFVVLSSASAALALDASPRGGEPGFVKVTGANTLLLPDAPGNNRLDTLENILQTGRLGLLFLIPGVDETLRVNGAAALSTDAGHLALFADSRRPPKLVIEVAVAEAYLHCAKALMRSALWSPAARVERSVLPSMGEMLNDQTGGEAVVETREQMLARYAEDL
jgi:PPOX class probable FMN-dependent enzyme